MTPFIALLGFFVFPATPVTTEPPVESAPQEIPAAPKLAESLEAAIEPATEDGLLSVRLTAYNAVPEQTDGDPGITASGVRTNPQVVAARSRDLADELPFGTVVAIEGPVERQRSCGYAAVEHLIGYRVIADTMHSRKKQWVDVLLDENDTVPHGGVAVNPSRVLGICDGVTVRVVGKIDVKDIPGSQLELAELVTGTKLAVAK